MQNRAIGKLIMMAAWGPVRPGTWPRSILAGQTEPCQVSGIRCRLAFAGGTFIVVCRAGQWLRLRANFPGALRPGRQNKSVDRRFQKIVVEAKHLTLDT